MNLDLVVKYLQARKEYLRAIDARDKWRPIELAAHTMDRALAELDVEIRLELKTEDAVGSVP